MQDPQPSIKNRFYLAGIDNHKFMYRSESCYFWVLTRIPRVERLMLDDENLSAHHRDPRYKMASSFAAAKSHVMLQ